MIRNTKGQFSIIAALLVAIVLIAAVMTTYSSIRYTPVQEQPQILSAVDETNLGLKEMLGFTVGYYGSVLKVTGNMSYAQELATNYLESSLNKLGDIRPEWGTIFSLTNLSLNANWFSNKSYSQGTLSVNYNLTGLGISGVSYSTSTRLDVEITNSSSANQAQLSILMDDNQPLINLGKSNLQFYSYDYQASNWKLTEATGIASYANGTYVIDLPLTLLASSYVIQVQDTRGLIVLASSFSQVTSTLNWNTAGFSAIPDYVDNANLDVLGTHSDFAAQQSGPDGIYDTLTEAASGTTPVSYYPTTYSLLGSTTLAGGSLNDLQTNNGVYMSFSSFPSSFSGSATFGTQTKGSSSSSFSYYGTPRAIGSRYNTGTSGGLATSISAYLSYTASSDSLGNTNYGYSGSSIMDTLRGQRFTTSSTVVAQSISAYVSCTTSAKNMKAAIYDSSGNLISSTEEKSVGTGTNWQTFNFASPPILTASTQYILVVWSHSGSGTADLKYSSTYGGNGRTASQTYGTWPSSQSFSTNSYQYSIYCNYLSTFNAQTAIYSSDGRTLIASSEEKTLSTVNGWVTFNFINQPTLSASTYYVLAAQCSDTSNVAFYYNGYTGDYYAGSTSYPNWPSSLSDQGSRAYSIYCTYSSANQYTVQVELTGSASNPSSWNDLVWTIDSSASTSSVSTTFQLYNAVTGLYPTSGDGFMTATLNTGDQTKLQTIVTNPSNFVNSSGYWKVNITAVKSTSSPFDLNLDLVQYSPDVPNYALNLQEQWLNVNASNPRQDLCIKTGTMGSEPLIVQVLHGGTWYNLMTLNSNCFNNVSLAPYIDSANLTIRFVGSNDLNDPTPDSWNIDAAYIKDEPDINFLVNLQESTFTLEILQNGTMRWLGQDMQLTTQTLPIPPVPVKAIHVNQTIGGVNQEVPFQIEDWASEYQIPLGLTSNTTVFSNRQMIVFLLNSKVTDFTIWWDGNDNATQTPMAYTNNYFTSDNPTASTLSNGKITLQFGSFNAKSTVVGTSTYSTATFMRINQEASSYGAGLAYVIHHGVVRDIVQQEAEWGTGGSGIGGVDGCPNLYANIILKLPANATYYTYQLRLMFIDSPQQRTISNLCPIQLTTSLTSVQTQTENGTLAGFPILQNGTGTFSDYASGGWTAHHFSQFISDTGKGAGIMFTDIANQRLYAFDSFPSSTSIGALKASAGLLELLPVSSGQVQFQYAYDITWAGAVVTFDDTTPVCNLYDGTTPMGLWILAEYPPTITLNAKS